MASFAHFAHVDVDAVAAQQRGVRRGPARRCTAVVAVAAECAAMVEPRARALRGGVARRSAAVLAADEDTDTDEDAARRPPKKTKMLSAVAAGGGPPVSRCAEAAGVCTKKPPRASKAEALRDVEEAHLAHGFGAARAAQARCALLAWWDVGHREMPWRRETDAPPLAPNVWAYRVWVSEVMLQQTQVDRVRPYFEKWTLRWPTVDALAAASVDEVRSMWTGLGYYRRCAFLLEGAAQISSSGAFPTSRDEWLKVKGVGAYTAAAISSIVYGERTPVVDGNVIRVLSRLSARRFPERGIPFF